MTASSFNRRCAVTGLMFLLLTAGGKTVWYAYRGLPQAEDYPQYYMGGLIARHGAWEAMYPVPKTSEGDADRWGFAQSSEMRPRYRELASRAGVEENAVRYLEPPPFTLLLLPLSFFPYKVSFYVWTFLLIIAAWGIGLQAGKFFTLSLGRETRWAGMIVLLVCLSPQAHRWVRIGNISVVLGWLIGYATLELVRRDGPRGAAAMVVGAVAKYAIIVLGPLYLAMRRWRTIAWGVVFAAVLIGTSLLLMPRGADGPYAVFFRDLAPMLARTGSIAENQALYPTIMRMLHLEKPPLPRPLEIGFRIVQVVTLVGLLALIFLKPLAFWDRPAHVFAAALALVAWMLVFSPICWEHYHAYLAPFWGWLIYEGTKSRTKMVIALFAIACSYLPTSLLLHQVAGGRFKLPEPLFSHLLCAAVLMLGMSLWAIAWNPDDPAVVGGHPQRSEGSREPTQDPSLRSR